MIYRISNLHYEVFIRGQGSPLRMLVGKISGFDLKMNISVPVYLNKKTGFLKTKLGRYYIVNGSEELFEEIEKDIERKEYFQECQ